MMRFALPVAAALLPVAGQADVAERLEAAYRGWAQEHGVTAGVLAIWQQGTPQRQGHLGTAPDSVIETASLSKAITAVCAAHLVQDGVWQLETTSHDVLGEGVRGITLAQLLTHTSGLAPDQTQISMMVWLDRPGSRARNAALRALGRATQEGTQGTYGYNHENYAVIGAMIAAQTGQSYADFCKARVLEPAGVTTAAGSERTGRFLPWGGWQMMADDYAAFHWHAYGPDGIIGADMARWPAKPVGGGVAYGMGMYHRAARGSCNHWHFGGLCFPGRLNVGSDAVMWREGYHVTASYAICADWPQMAALDAALIAAVFQ